MARAINVVGIEELRLPDLSRNGQSRLEAEAIRDQIRTEALNGALRIAALAKVLTANRYMRLDP